MNIRNIAQLFILIVILSLNKDIETFMIGRIVRIHPTSPDLLKSLKKLEPRIQKSLKQNGTFHIDTIKWAYTRFGIKFYVYFEMANSKCSRKFHSKFSQKTSCCKYLCYAEILNGPLMKKYGLIKLRCNNAKGRL